MIGVTMGDASGIGPEIILKAYRSGALTGDFIVIGDYDIISYCNELLDYDVAIERINSPEDRVENRLGILDMAILDRNDLDIGRISKASGFAALKYVEKASKMALDGTIDAMVTLPMNKESTRLSFPDFTGHTEFIAGMCGQSDYTMMLAGDKLIVTHVSTHVSLKQAVDGLSGERIYKVILLTHDLLLKLYDKPRIGVAGLNPHAGEHGSFGDEETAIIGPAVELAKQQGIDVNGPVSPDVIFVKAVKGEYDAVVCMYHDQGHIPLKLTDMDGGINVTLGLKVIRTSVDHGTAFDIAYKGQASIRSFVSAYDFAQRLIADR